MELGARQNDEAGYSSLARYHYGLMLYQGRGVKQDRDAALKWLERAAGEGIIEAQEFLKKRSD